MGFGVVFGVVDVVDIVWLIVRDGEVRYYGGEEDEICRRMYGFGEEWDLERIRFLGWMVGM